MGWMKSFSTFNRITFDNGLHCTEREPATLPDLRGKRSKQRGANKVPRPKWNSRDKSQTVVFCGRNFHHVFHRVFRCVFRSRGLKDTVFAIAEISGNFAGNFRNFSAISGNFRQFPETSGNFRQFPQFPAISGNFRQFPQFPAISASSGNFPHSNFAGDFRISAIFQQFPAISPAFRKIPVLLWFRYNKTHVLLWF